MTARLWADPEHSMGGLVAGRNQTFGLPTRAGVLLGKGRGEFPPDQLMGQRQCER